MYQATNITLFSLAIAFSCQRSPFLQGSSFLLHNSKFSRFTFPILRNPVSAQVSRCSFSNSLSAVIKMTKEDCELVSDNFNHQYIVNTSRSCLKIYESTFSNIKTEGKGGAIWCEKDIKLIIQDSAFNLIIADECGSIYFIGQSFEFTRSCTFRSDGRKGETFAFVNTKDYGMFNETYIESGTTIDGTSAIHVTGGSYLTNGLNISHSFSQKGCLRVSSADSFNASYVTFLQNPAASVLYIESDITFSYTNFIDNIPFSRSLIVANSGDSIIKYAVFLRNQVDPASVSENATILFDTSVFDAKYEQTQGITYKNTEINDNPATYQLTFSQTAICTASPWSITVPPTWKFSKNMSLIVKSVAYGEVLLCALIVFIPWVIKKFKQHKAQKNQ